MLIWPTKPRELETIESINLKLVLETVFRLKASLFMVKNEETGTETSWKNQGPGIYLLFFIISGSRGFVIERFRI